MCRTSRDLAEQCIKVLELVCTREAGAIFEAGGLSSVLNFIRDSGTHIHKVFPRFWVSDRSVHGPNIYKDTKPLMLAFLTNWPIKVPGGAGLYLSEAPDPLPHKVLIYIEPCRKDGATIQPKSFWLGRVCHLVYVMVAIAWKGFPASGDIWVSSRDQWFWRSDVWHNNLEGQGNSKTCL